MLSEKYLNLRNIAFRLVYNKKGTLTPIHRFFQTKIPSSYFSDVSLRQNFDDVQLSMFSSSTSNEHVRPDMDSILNSSPVYSGIGVEVMKGQ